MIAPPNKGFDKLDAHAIGSLCATWAVIDRALDQLLAALIPTTIDRVTCITTSASDVSSRCEMLTRLITLEHPTPAFRNWLISLLRRVSGEIGPLRNRYVHDAWAVRNGELLRYDRRAKIGKAQSHQEATLQFDLTHVTPFDEVQRVDERAKYVMTGLLFAEQDLTRWRKTKSGRDPLPEWLPMSKPNARYQTRQEHSEALAQGLAPAPYILD